MPPEEPKPEIGSPESEITANYKTSNAKGMSDDDQGAKRYDSEDRTFQFAKAVRDFVKLFPRTIANAEDIRQLVKASESVGANYIEANESLSKKDFAMRVKISRKEAKESRLWLRLLDRANDGAIEKQRALLVREATELMNIFGAIVRKSSG